MLKNKEFYNIVGVDPSLNCVKETVKSVGCDAYKYSLFELNLNSIGKFDLVIFSHVMEHLLDVKLAINILKNILNEDGFIYIECPNAMRYHEIIHAPFQEFNTEHINHFTENSFANLFVNNGFKKITLGNRVFKISSGDKYNAVFGLFQFEDNKCNLLSKDKDIIIAINKYINKSQIIFNEIENRIATLNNSMPVIIYGLGQLSYKILKSNYIKEKNIKYLIDNNPINKGKKLKGVPITSFQEFLESYNRQEDIQIVIMSTIYENVIRNEIIDKLPSVKTIMGFSDIVEKRHNPSSDYH